MPANYILALHFDAVSYLVFQVRRCRACQKFAHLCPKGGVLIAKGQIHRRNPWCMELFIIGCLWHKVLKVLYS